jgi:hypothetical protein
LLGILRLLLLLGFLILSSLASPGHCADHGTGCRSLAGIPGNGPDRCTTGGSPSSSTHSLSPTCRRAR